jgi:uncharacterized protein (DUF1501 family)
MKRREFIQVSALASTALLVPGFLSSAAARSLITQAGANGKKLVVIQMSGGNDGLNTIIPYQNDIYYKLRPSLALKRQDMLVLNDELAMNCAMGGMKELFDRGYVSILNNVGYPNPDRSHFRSMDIWHSASDSDRYISTGWIGRYLDHQCDGCAKPYRAIEIDDTLSLAMKGYQVKGLALHNEDLFYKLAKEQHASTAPALSNDNLNYLYKTLRETEESAEYLASKSKIYASPVTYPNDGFAKNLKTIAELIVAGADTSVFYASLSGFDTHVNQQGQQERNLTRVSDAVGAFMADLEHAGRQDDVMILVFSEFGRRAAQNASNGTDHGKANNVFVISSRLSKAGIFNSSPDLDKLDEGDVAHTIDFRSIYATILDKWLGANDAQILGRKFDKLSFV